MAIVIAVLGWKSAANTDVPSSRHVALALSVIFSLVVGIGLMTLVFYSSRAGFDEPAKLIEADEHELSVIRQSLERHNLLAAV